MDNDSKIQQWVHSQGVYNCIVKVDNQFFKINATTGIQPASEGDRIFPLVEAPDWLQIMCREYTP